MTAKQDLDTVSLRGSFQNFQRAALLLFIWESPPWSWQGQHCNALATQPGGVEILLACVTVTEISSDLQE